MFSLSSVIVSRFNAANSIHIYIYIYIHTYEIDRCWHYKAWLLLPELSELTFMTNFN